jgi:hypothetical protein
MIPVFERAKTPGRKATDALTELYSIILLYFIIIYEYMCVNESYNATVWLWNIACFTYFKIYMCLRRV